MGAFEIEDVAADPPWEEEEKVPPPLPGEPDEVQTAYGIHTCLVLYIPVYGINAIKNRSKTQGRYISDYIWKDNRLF